MKKLSVFSIFIGSVLFVVVLLSQAATGADWQASISQLTQYKFKTYTSGASDGISKPNFEIWE
ncbi:MAG: hypothetical protein LBU20_01525 [Candidatus Nomurabacteria bacterium]|jgi:hypothetical protein|nr:hypothetical protein [Candidatus Nomurabacteria bacterium]